METQTKAFERYLQKRGYARKTVSECVRLTDAFLMANPSGSRFTHKEVVRYLDEIGESYHHTATVSKILLALKQYFYFLIETEKREDHPCRTLYIKSKKSRDIIHQDLFSSGELEQLMNRKEYFDIYALKHQVTTSLLIYQGLTAGEILRLRVQDVDFDKGVMFIRPSRSQNGRYLEIHPRQFQKLHTYIYDVRYNLVKTDTDLLLISSRSVKPVTIDDISDLTKTCKYLFPDRNLNPITIRQSVISNWLNEKKLPLEQVQLMAGHKWISSTEKYRHTNLSEQRELMNKWFPL